MPPSDAWIRGAIGSRTPRALQGSDRSLFSVPPLAVRRRFPAKVGALMALCDGQLARLAATTATCRRLVDALLTETLAPVDAREMEAAE